MQIFFTSSPKEATDSKEYVSDTAMSQIKKEKQTLLVCDSRDSNSKSPNKEDTADEEMRLGRANVSK